MSLCPKSENWKTNGVSMLRRIMEIYCYFNGVLFCKRIAIENWLRWVLGSKCKCELVKNIQVCSNKGSEALFQGKIKKKVICIWNTKLDWRNFKKFFFSGTTRSISTKLCTNHPWLKWNSSLFKWRPHPLMRRNLWNSNISKNHLLKNHWANCNQTKGKASLYRVDLSFLCFFF